MMGRIIVLLIENFYLIILGMMFLIGIYLLDISLKILRDGIKYLPITTKIGLLITKVILGEEVYQKQLTKFLSPHQIRMTGWYYLAGGILFTFGSIIALVLFIIGVE